MGIGDLINNKLRNTLINKNGLSNKTPETLKTLKNYASCDIRKSINKIENCSIESKKEERGKKKYDTICELNDKLFRTDNKLNKAVLCERYKGKETEKLTDKCRNKKT